MAIFLHRAFRATKDGDGFSCLFYTAVAPAFGSLHLFAIQRLWEQWDGQPHLSYLEQVNFVRCLEARGGLFHSLMPFARHTWQLQFQDSGLLRALTQRPNQGWGNRSWVIWSSPVSMLGFQSIGWHSFSAERADGCHPLVGIHMSVDEG